MLYRLLCALMGHLRLCIFSYWDCKLRFPRNLIPVCRRAAGVRDMGGHQGNFATIFHYIDWCLSTDGK